MKNSENIYAKLEMENENYDEIKNNFLQGLVKFEENIKNIEEQESKFRQENEPEILKLRDLKGEASSQLSEKEWQFKQNLRDIEYKKKQVIYQLKKEKEKVENEIASLDKSIANGYKNIEELEALSSSLDELKSINLIAQFTISADKKSFLPSYEGIEYIFKDSRIYEKDIATSAQGVLMNAALGFLGNTSILVSAYKNRIYKVDFQLSYFVNRK